MSKARELSQRAGVDGALSNRNLIINGAMQVAQRGTSVTAGASNTYTLDRWIAREGVVSQSTDVPAGKGFKNSLFYDNGGVRSSLNFRQVIEDGFTSLDGQDVTISFWIKTSVTADVWVDLHDTHTSSTFNCPANTWVHHTYTASNVDTSVFTNYWGGPHAHVDFNFGSSYPDVYITGVQLEVGDTATPFEHRSYGQELALCQRYYEKSYGDGVALGTATQGGMYIAPSSNYNSGAVLYGPAVRFAVAKRSSPSFSFWSYTGLTNNWHYGIAGFSEAVSNAPTPYAIATSGFYPYILSVGSTSNVMYGHWAADAEL